MRRQLATIGIAAMLLLTACGGSTTPTAHRTAVSPEPGQCVANERADLDDFAPDLTSVVSCSTSHAYEIVDVQPVPARFLNGSSTKQRLQNRTALTKAAGVGHLQRSFRDFALERCRLAIVNATGLQSLKIRGKSAAAGEVYPLLGGAELRLNLTPAQQWDSGDRDFMCSIRYTKHQNGSETRVLDRIRSRTALPSYRTLLTGGFPAARRQCVTYDKGDTRVLVSCTKQHYGELLFRYDARKVFSKQFMDALGKRAYNNQPLTDRQIKALNKPCFDSMDQLFGPDWSDKLSAIGEAFSGADTGWEADLNRTTSDVNCLAVAYADNEDLPPGSLFNGAQTVQLVKVGERLDS